MSEQSVLQSIPAFLMRQPCLSGILAVLLAFAGMPQAVGAPRCKPTLTFGPIQFSPMQPPTMERKWAAIVSVDASRCAAHSSGTFEIGFTRLKETAPDADFRARFIWRAPAVTVEVDFAADEAVGRYWIERVTPCLCGE